MKKSDKSYMHRVFLDFPKQFRVGLEAAKNIKIPGKFNKVLICGMGGSALPGDILDIWLSAFKIPLPLFIHRNYNLPYQADKNSLVVCISYSGNTEETISSLEAARRKKLPVAAIGSGGRLAELCQKHKIPAAIVPKGYQPRMALGFQFAALMKILVNCGLIKDNLKSILALEKNLKPAKLENQGKKLAKKLINKTPVIYSSDRLKNLARIWKIKFNEVSKTLALYNYFPELNHNEIVGFEEVNKDQISNKKVCVFILRDLQDSYPRILKQMEITKDLIEKEGVKVEFIDMTGKNMMEKIFSSIILGFWTSFWLAMEYKVDPTEIKTVDEFKKRLAKK